MKVTKNQFKSLVLIVVTLSIVSLACLSALQAENILDQDTANQVSTEVSSVVEEIETLVEEPTTYTAVDIIAQNDALVALYEDVSPGVVAITTLQRTGDVVTGGGTGSGFVIDEEGHIVTNYHVVEGADEIQVAFTSGIKVRSELIGTDTDSDLAVIKVDLPPEELTPISLGDSDQLRVGQTVIAIGNPFGLNGTMTTGIISSIGRTLDSLNFATSGQAFSAGDIIQTDAAINPGNSGGPLLDLNGEVIGVNRAIRTNTTTADFTPVNSGIGFAVSINIVKRVVPSLISEGSYSYPYLGISSFADIPLEAAEELGLERAVGALVTTVVPDGPADEAGVEVDDVILAIDGEEVLNFSEMLSYLFINTSPGDVVELEVFRAGETISLEMTLGARPVNSSSQP
ncbi:MAG: PDZ domain-containing protein [candidate division Zixibacteria bacterium]|nr:PDZ domain-containing protein [Gammaproteobacteria bacterium]NIX56780.1 PDZ domain-containing protein [candidate division Zixibacteria bacterium]